MPVGLLGELMTINLVFGDIAFSIPFKSTSHLSDSKALKISPLALFKISYLDCIFLGFKGILFTLAAAN